MTIFLRQLLAFSLPLIIVLFWLMHRGLLKGDMALEPLSSQAPYCSSDLGEDEKIWKNSY